MKFQYQLDYRKLSDKQIVEKILADPHDEEAAVYLLYDLYAPLLHKLYYRLTSDDTWIDDCFDELFMHIKGKDGSWRILANFKWLSSFPCWLKKVAYGKFCEVLKKVIENRGRNVSIDSDDPQKPSVKLSDGGKETMDRHMDKVMLMEAIGKLEDEDQRFAIRKRLEGYKSKEIATLMKMKWEKYGIVRYNNEHEVVVPDEGYVNVRVQRAKKELKIIMSN